jgi:hypothetical protein
VREALEGDVLASIAGIDGRVASLGLGAIVWITTFTVAKARIQPRIQLRRDVAAELPQDARALWQTRWPAAAYVAVVIASGMAVDGIAGFHTQTSTALAVVPLLALVCFALARRCQHAAAAAMLALGVQAATRAALFAIDTWRALSAGTASGGEAGLGHRAVLPQSQQSADIAPGAGFTHQSRNLRIGPARNHSRPDRHPVPDGKHDTSAGTPDRGNRRGRVVEPTTTPGGHPTSPATDSEPVALTTGASQSPTS